MKKRSWLSLGLMLLVALGVGAYFQAKQTQPASGIATNHPEGGRNAGRARA